MSGRAGVERRWDDDDLRLSVGYADDLLKSFPVHRHNHVELVVVTEGEGIHVVNDVEHPITAGDVFVIQGEQTHGFKDLRGIFLWNLAFDPVHALPARETLMRMPGFIALFTLEPYRRANEPFRNRLRLDSAALRMAVALIKKACDEIEEHRSGWREMSRAVFAELVVFLSRRYEGITGTDDVHIHEIGRVISMMAERRNEELTLPFLAEKAGMPVNSFLRVFRRMTGRSPIDYLISLRVEMAKKLLTNSRMSVGGIAAECGFSDTNYFSRCFRKTIGCSPREFRNGAVGNHLSPPQENRVPHPSLPLAKGKKPQPRNPAVFALPRGGRIRSAR